MIKLVCGCDPFFIKAPKYKIQNSILNMRNILNLLLSLQW